KPFWSQPLELVETLKVLNIDDERARINKKREDGSKGSNKLRENDAVEFEPILLSYITGKDGIAATVDTSAISPDLWFSCPSGEVGAHALYIILENIIRNS